MSALGPVMMGAEGVVLGPPHDRLHVGEHGIALLSGRTAGGGLERIPDPPEPPGEAVDVHGDITQQGELGRVGQASGNGGHGGEREGLCDPEIEVRQVPIVCMPFKGEQDSTVLELDRRGLAAVAGDSSAHEIDVPIRV